MTAREYYEAHADAGDLAELVAHPGPKCGRLRTLPALYLEEDGAGRLLVVDRHGEHWIDDAVEIGPVVAHWCAYVGADAPAWVE